MINLLILTLNACIHLSAIQIFQTVLHTLEKSLKSQQLFMLITVHFCLILFSDFVHTQSEIKAKPMSNMFAAKFPGYSFLS